MIFQVKNYLTPEYWNTLSREGNEFYVELAKKYIDQKNSDKPKVLIRGFIQENVDFVNTEKGMDAEASAKETQNFVLEFLADLFSEQGVTKEEIVDVWHDIFWSGIDH
jgi:hypothetical protein